MNTNDPDQKEQSRLFLSSGGLLSLSLGPLFPNADQTSVATSQPQASVSGLLALGHVVALDVRDGVLDSDVLDGEGSVDVGGVALGLALGGEGGLGGVDLLGAGVEFLELAALTGEEDEAGLVLLQAGNILDERLLGVVDAAVVNRDTDGGRELLGDTSFLNFTHE